MQLEVVNIEDVYPDENNPRQKFDGIDELAESFELNKERPGEPFTPPILVRDGGIYRIVDGERRYKALKKRRKTSFTANVCEDMDEASTLIAMLATDNKQPLSELEKSRGVQQMLLLGVDPIKVDKVTKGRDAARIKRAMATVDDAAEDMSLDRLLAIEEHMDNPDYVAALTNCSESEWQTIYASQQREIAANTKLHEFIDYFGSNGIPYYNSDNDLPDNCYYQGFTDTLSGFTPKDGSIYVVRKTYNSSGIFEYVERNDLGEEDKEEAEIRRKALQLEQETEEAYEKRSVWFAERLTEPQQIPTVVGVLEELFYDSSDGLLTMELCDDYQIALGKHLCPTMLAWIYADKVAKKLPIQATALVRGTLPEYAYDGIDDILRLVDAFKTDGYQPDEWEQEFYDFLRSKIAEAEEAMDDD